MILFWIGSGLISLIVVEALLSMVASIFEARRSRLAMQLSAEQLQKEIAKAGTSATRTKTMRAWRGYRRFILDEKVNEADHICSFHIRPLDEEPLPNFEPGQHLGFQLRIPGKRKPQVRNYSLSAAPGDRRRYKITVKQIPPPPDQPGAPPGQGSTYLHESLSPGDLLEVSSPAGKFVLDRSDPRPAVFLAGGIGVTPLISMIDTVCNENIARKCYFIHAVTNKAEHAFRDHLQQLAEKHSNIELHFFYSQFDENAETESENPNYNTGFIDVERLAKITGGGDLRYYICGPPPMMNSLIPALEESGVPTESISNEAFGPASTRKKATPNATDSENGSPAQKPLMLYFKTSNRSLTWDQRSPILEMADEAGIYIDSSCRSGNCGTCEVRLQDGQVKYDDEPEAEITEGHCLACVAKPITDIVIEA